MASVGPNGLKSLAHRVPPGTWDTHMHVVDLDNYPAAGIPQYQPTNHSLSDAVSALGNLSIKNMVLVQPSFYGDDNSCTLAALRTLGDRGFAIIQFDPDTINHDQLRRWHAAGVRGTRLNYQSVGEQVSESELTRRVARCIEVTKHLDWILQLYIPFNALPVLERVITSSGSDTRFIIDHLGHPSRSAISSASSASELQGFDSLMRLLDSGRVWIKLSALYRIHPDPKQPIVRDLLDQIIRARPDRCIFATDWPHTRQSYLFTDPA